MHVRRSLVAAPLVALGLLLAGASSLMAAGPDPDATLTVTKPVNIMKLSKQTPIPEGTSYYCAVGVFIPFDDLAGWTPVTATYTYLGNPTPMTIGAPPFSDAAEINGLVFAPVGGQHHTQVGDASYSQGGTLGDDCAAMVDRTNSFFGDTATVTYAHTRVCSRAITTLLKARKAVTAAARRVARAKTGTARATAKAGLRKATTKRTTATRAFTRVCR